MGLFRRNKNIKKLVIRQIIDLVPRWMIESCAKKHKSDKACCKYKTYDQFVALTYGQLNKWYTLNDISTGIAVSQTFIGDLGLNQRPVRSTMSDKKRNWKEGQTDIFNLESTKIGATSWVHVDVREFQQEFLTKQYFVKNTIELNGKNIVALANELGFKDTCSCNSGITSNAVDNSSNSSIRVDPKTLTASDEIIKFIKDWEGLEINAYNDSKGYCTIGYGHLIKKKKCNEIIIPDEFKNGITEEEATKIFKEDLKQFEKAIQRDVLVNLHQKEFDALVDLLFNCGAYFLSTGKAPKLYKSLLDEKYEDAAKEFLDIENKKRRKQNYEIFINGNYDSTH
jgi:GH24 family phage-related lysozyme (muramidase)